MTLLGAQISRNGPARDRSAYYKTHDNFFPFSVGGLKSDFGGHDNHQYNNL